MSTTAVPTSWRWPLVALLAVWAIVFVVHGATALSIAEVWDRSNSYAHGWFVPPIALWLMWERRVELWQRVARPAWGALPLLGAAGLLWAAGALVSVNAAMHFALVAMLVCAVPVLWGWQTAHVLVFPLCFLFLAVPFGDFMLPVLMNWTADFTVLALRWTGIPVYREGLHFIIPSGSWSVAEACSGIRYLVASVMAGCLYGYMHFRSFRLRVGFVVLSVSVSLIANWLRAYIIVLLGHLSGNKIATGVDHLIYGWLFFAVVLVFLFWIGSRWHDPVEPATSETAGASPAEPPCAPVSCGRFAAATLAASAVVAMSALVVPGLQYSVAHAPVQLQALSPQAGWTAAAPDDVWQPAYAHANQTAHTLWRSPDGQMVGLFVHYFRGQGGDRKLVSASHVAVEEDDDFWKIVDTSVHAQNLGSSTVQWNEVVLRNVGKGGLGTNAYKLRVWQVYWVHGQWVGSPMRAKLQGALQLLEGQGDDGAIVTLYTEDTPQASATLATFMQTQGGALARSLAATQGRN